MKQKFIYKFILIILGIAILSLVLVTNRSQAANQVRVTAKVDPTLTLSLIKIKDPQGYKLTVVTNYFLGFVVNLFKRDSIIVLNEGSIELDSWDFREFVVCSPIY